MFIVRTQTPLSTSKFSLSPGLAATTRPGLLRWISWNSSAFSLQQRSRCWVRRCALRQCGKSQFLKVLLAERFPAVRSSRLEDLHGWRKSLPRNLFRDDRISEVRKKGCTAPARSVRPVVRPTLVFSSTSSTILSWSATLAESSHVFAKLPTAMCIGTYRISLL